MLYRAAAALPSDDCERATATLREQLRTMAEAARARPRWSTLRVSGPETCCGPGGRELFEWTASVQVRGPRLEEPPDAAVPAGDDRSGPVTQRQPFPAIT